MNGNNQVTLTGCVASKMTFSHECHGEHFYKFTLAVERESGTKDFLPVLISENILKNVSNYENEIVCVIGQFRSHNMKEDEKKRLLLYIFAFEFYVTDERSINEIVLTGYVCKEPIYRKTPLGREVTDVMIAIPRPCGKSDYIPCISWGRNARYAAGIQPGMQIAIYGRIQSREYKIIQGTETKIAYEVSIMKID